MKILIIMSGFFPGKKYGGPPVSVDNFCSLLNGNADCYIVTHNHDLDENIPYSNISKGWNDRGNSKIMYLCDKEYCYKTFKQIVEDLNPDYIYLQGLFQSCVIPCLIIAKILNVKVVLAPRGELCSGAFKKKYKKIPYLIFIRTLGLLRQVFFQSTSEEETNAIVSYLGVTPDRISLLNNIPSIPAKFSDYNHKESGKAKLVFVSRILWKKNLLEAIKYMKNINGDVIFDIYGPKEDASYWDRCQKAIDDLPQNIKVEYKGVLSHDDIHNTFRQYDAFLFPTLSENYGHVIAEALISGCIPVISDKTPWNDITLFGAGWAIPLESQNMFEQAIQEVVDMDDNIMCAKRTNIECYLKNKLNLSKLKEDYLSVFK